ncbi:carboxymuconolactone decarboxylase family protein [Pseudomonas sp. NPDC007930]|uniref:carboxymuconolactone decarboxylase family protein n=1 Tax=Pseudomonas sp. NPDC007930 TaxID=3364417 RepID=UPI0036E1C2EF
MPRIDILTPQQVAPATAGTLERLLQDYGPYASLLGAVAHRPPALEHLFAYLVQSRRDALISPRHLEIALLTASKAHACHYCIVLHTPKLAAHGISQAAIDHLLDDQVPGLDAHDLLVRDYARLVTLTPERIPDEVHRRLREVYSQAQIVELTLRIALCSFFKRFNEALEVPDEDTVAFELPKAEAP